MTKQEVWRVSTSAGSRKLRKSFGSTETASSSSHSTKEPDAPGRLSAAAASSSNGGVNQAASTHGDISQVCILTLAVFNVTSEP